MDKAEVHDAVKHDKGKLRLDLVPCELTVAVATVMAYGAEKYDEHNWRKGLVWSRVYAAAQRHLTAWWAGDETDNESGINHVAHAACCLAFLLNYMEQHPELDDRYRAQKKPAASEETASRTEQPK